MTGLNSLTKSPSQKTKRRIGRGGKCGKTAGRGHKGQMQHGGHGVRPELRDMIKKLPKLRGHGINRSRTVNSSKVAHTPVNLTKLEEAFKAGEVVSPTTLVEKGIVSNSAGRAPKVKILGTGELKIKLTIEKCAVSKTAIAAIEKAGGEIKHD